MTFTKTTINRGKTLHFYVKGHYKTTRFLSRLHTFMFPSYASFMSHSHKHCGLGSKGGETESEKREGIWITNPMTNSAQTKAVNRAEWRVSVEIKVQRTRPPVCGRGGGGRAVAGRLWGGGGDLSPVWICCCVIRTSKLTVWMEHNPHPISCTRPQRKPPVLVQSL